MYVCPTYLFRLNTFSLYLPNYQPTNHCRRKIVQLALWCLLDCSPAVQLHCRSIDFSRVRNRIDEICPIRFPGQSVSAFWSKHRLGRDSESLGAKSKKQYLIWKMTTCVKHNDIRNVARSCTLMILITFVHRILT